MADDLEDRLIEMTAQRDRWRRAFMIEASRSETGHELAEGIAALLNTADLVVTREEPLVTVLAMLADGLTIYHQRYARALTLPEGRARPDLPPDLERSEPDATGDPVDRDP